MGYPTVSWTSKHFHIQYMGKKNLLESFVASHLVRKWHQTANVLKKSSRKPA